jgi:hypothetical protein
LFVLILFCFFAVPRIEPRASSMLGKHSINRVTPPALFGLVVFHIGSHAFAHAGLGSRSSYLCLLSSWDNRCALGHPAHIQFL